MYAILYYTIQFFTVLFSPTPSFICQGGSFHRNAGHVLQAQLNSHQPGMAFQEYSDKYPHKRLTMGYAGTL